MKKPPQKPRFELRHTQGVPVATANLLADLKRVSAQLGGGTVTFRDYDSRGTYSSGTIQARFGGWNQALKAAGLDISNEQRIDQDRLFENLERLWIALGRQPSKRDLGTQRSEFSEGPYARAFGSWRKALQAFVDWGNSDEPSSQQAEKVAPPVATSPRSTTRDPNLRTRFLVMKRDGFRCRYCGKSPATHAGVELVLDHVHAWSKGGETTPENLVTSCAACNAGKGNS
jgi:hypothetical protein